VNPVIETPRLVLRPATIEDLDTLHALWTDPGVRRYLWDDLVISRARARETLEACIATFADRGFGLWLVHRRDDGRAIGFAGLRPFDDDVEYVIGIAPAWWRQGYGREAVSAVLAFAFDRLGLPRVLGQTDPPNAASIALMESLGMRRLPVAFRDGLTLVRYEQRATHPLERP
jgi:ribosomal-protein-alanine N-acetyltransferase